MVNLLKTFGKGILYIIGFPFFVVALLIFGVIGIFLFIFHLIKSIIYFFTGQKFFPELPEDKQLRLKQEAAYAAAHPESTIIEQDPMVQENIESPMIEQVAFSEEPAYEKPIYQEPKYRPLYEEPLYNEPKLEEPLPVQEPEVEEPKVEEEAPLLEEATFEQEENDEDVLSELTRDEPEHSIDTSIEEKEEPVDDEPLEEYVPRGSTYLDDVEEDDASTGGVDIDYDVR